MKMEKVGIDEGVMLSRRECPYYNMLYRGADHISESITPLVLARNIRGWGNIQGRGT
jgi:hypothetical protein